MWERGAVSYTRGGVLDKERPRLVLGGVNLSLVVRGDGDGELCFRNDADHLSSFSIRALFVEFI